MNSIRRAHEARTALAAKLNDLQNEVEKRGEETAEDIEQRSKVEADFAKATEAMEAAITADEAEKRYEAAFAASGFTAPTAPAAVNEEARALEAFRSGESNVLELRAALQVGNTGANVVDPTMFSEILKGLTDYSTVVAAGARILNTSSGEQINFPTRAGIPTAALVAEGGTFGASDGTLGTLALNAYKYGFISQVSDELVQDAAFDIRGEVVDAGSEAIGVGLGTAFISGTGSSQPEGLLTQTLAADFASASAITTDELIDTIHLLSQPYRKGAAFIMADSTVALVRKLKGSDGQYVWQPSSQAGVPDTLFGYPVYADSGMPVVASDAKTVAFANLKRGMVVRLAGGVKVTRSDEYAFGSGLVSWKFEVRADSGIVDASAIVLRAMAT